jgi:hypothetical protein
MGKIEEKMPQVPAKEEPEKQIPVPEAPKDTPVQQTPTTEKAPIPTAEQQQEVPGEVIPAVDQPIPGAATPQAGAIIPAVDQTFPGGDVAGIKETPVIVVGALPGSDGIPPLIVPASEQPFGN